MNIGVFDSGLGGLTILRALVRDLPQYSYLYLGDTQRVPYGNRSQETIYQYTKEAVDYLFKRDCQLIIIACNTVSAQALRRIQQEYLPAHYPDRRVLGVIVPTAEAVQELGASRVGILATTATIESKAFPRECKKVSPKVKIFQQAAPLLVPLIEHDGLKWSMPILEAYLRPLLEKKIDTLVLGCTHYPHAKRQIRRIVGKGVHIVAQDEILPKKLEAYLVRHPEIEQKLSKSAKIQILVTDITPTFRKMTRRWFGNSGGLTSVNLPKVC